MRIGELSRRTGVPVPTIKYYVREGLLPQGELTSPNQAHYGEAHERRLRLIRALLEVGGLKVAAIAEVLGAVDDPARPLHKVLGAAADRLGAAGAAEDDAEAEAAQAAVEQLIARRGWQAHESNPAAADLSRALAAMGRVGHGAFTELLDEYADAAELVARADLGYVDRRVAVEDLVESVVIGTVLGEVVFNAMRRLAHVDASARLYGVDGTGGAERAGREAGEGRLSEDR
ncbi:MerR family transcriptional regulator [Streptomyces sp. MZ04]|uniref:MerR family transcriptional regulator n=1 Tax=Streptomyces sp. MZ04 TaxID=2559236 RepID=UPI00107EE745|nr:MerR family transcriptional regulator [Streptomyces sp. MZ04]TGB10789.1 MerR family transcriptional regulator [Streptomyces sp. MZ04]